MDPKAAAQLLEVVVQLGVVRRSYGRTAALGGVSLQVRRGEAVAVMDRRAAGSPHCSTWSPASTDRRRDRSWCTDALIAARSIRQ
jgi:hypothetical protein